MGCASVLWLCHLAPEQRGDRSAGEHPPGRVYVVSRVLRGLGWVGDVAVAGGGDGDHGVVVGVEEADGPAG